MRSLPKEPSGLLVLRVWLESTAEDDPADAIRGRVTLIFDLPSGHMETSVLAGSNAIVTAVEQWLIEFSLGAQS